MSRVDQGWLLAWGLVVMVPIAVALVWVAWLALRGPGAPL